MMALITRRRGANAYVPKGYELELARRRRIEAKLEKVRELIDLSSPRKASDVAPLNEWTKRQGGLQQPIRLLPLYGGLPIDIIREREEAKRQNERHDRGREGPGLAKPAGPRKHTVAVHTFGREWLLLYSSPAIKSEVVAPGGSVDPPRQTLKRILPPNLDKLQKAKEDRPEGRRPAMFDLV
ncbi:hypothetical protein WN55_08302 [Dufourea novaeangliae]|uniref:Uncharacterized protein n=1 Tax=Dufourea novaeangliae TaxID=178035 RepID=A0A154P6Q9_DUFNO|nr:hypothetical protein WN55_08302 [Dufourea novaeangliae]